MQKFSSLYNCDVKCENNKKCNYFVINRSIGCELFEEKELLPLKQKLELEQNRLVVSSDNLNLMKEEFELINLENELQLLISENEKLRANLIAPNITNPNNPSFPIEEVGPSNRQPQKASSTKKPINRGQITRRDDDKINDISVGFTVEKLVLSIKSNVKPKALLIVPVYLKVTNL